MAFSLQVVFDCKDPASLSKFYAEALHYKLQDPPAGYESWEKWIMEKGIPEEEWNSASAIVDPEGKGPRIYFQHGLYDQITLLCSGLFSFVASESLLEVGKRQKHGNKEF